ncbi:ABC transporter ATP-binding protein [Halococcus agarilyticus]|uniref:ABC transporter ATP-binding protein n=1 Tax=Halococcus agarilyticus TaxID=1232219 RepID=UPI000677F853|nr:ABC transporter ATP-binding protein [Halococcus agarilyticus]
MATNVAQSGDPSESTDDYILEVSNAEVMFDMDRGQSRVLDNVSIDIERGEAMGIVGESGSGKSMFASALLDAVVDPGQLRGEIMYHPKDGPSVDLTTLSTDEVSNYRGEELAMVLQGAQSAFNPTMTIRGHFEETLIAHNEDVEEGLSRARQLLSDLYLQADQVLDSYPHELSGGMKQRALIALSLVLNPSVLVMDEPTAALDLLMQRSIVSLLNEIREEYDITMLFITHDISLVSDISDRIAVMYAFEFIEIGTPEDTLQNPSHPYTRALVNAIPNLDTSIDEMQPIAGSSPDPVETLKGCSYHPRCPLADDRCRSEDPGLLDVDETHAAACFYRDEAREEIPLVSEREGTGVEDRSAGSSVSSEPRSDEPVVSLDDVEVHFENSRLFGLARSNTVKAVDGVSLDIYENDVVVLVGESGCGKTTLGKTAIGLQRPTAGTVSYRGQDIQETKGQSLPLLHRLGRNGDREETIPFKTIRRALQIIHQDPGSALNSNHTVDRILSEPLKRWNPDLDREDRRARIHAMLERVGITPTEDYITRYPFQLSGGEAQRVALIRALLVSPDMILADEAVSALDVSLRVETMNLMLDLQEYFNTSYLFISHNLANARYLATKANGRIGIMYLGELVEIGPVDQIINDPQHPYTKALHWATPDLFETEMESPPVRGLDIPDPSDQPDGCSFHTRCPEAREVCKKQDPALESGDNPHAAACFRTVEDHEYWDSPELGEAGSGD